MNVFDYWYGYYDSIFLKQKLQISPTFLSTLAYKSSIDTSFTKCKQLPELSHIFCVFQKFIHDKNTWLENDSDQFVLKDVQNNINLVAICLVVQKIYGYQYWHSRRRIQASICHFFSLLNYFLFSLIPVNGSTILKTKKSNNLSIKFSNLQNFINLILPQLNQISKFMLQSKFNEQKALSIKFLTQIKQLFENLPNMNKNKMKLSTELSKYLYLIIPIQISKHKYKCNIRKTNRNISISNKNNQRYHTEDYLQTNQNSIKKSFKPKSLILLNQSKINKIHNLRLGNKLTTLQSQYIYEHQNLIEQIPNIFQFSQNVRKHSFQKKKITLTTQNTRFESVEYRKISVFVKPSSQLQKEKQLGIRSLSIAKDKKSLQQPVITERSKKSSHQKLHKNIEQLQAQNNRQNNLISGFSRYHEILKEHNSLLNKRQKTKINIQTGKMKGWNLIREYIKQKIAKRKIKKLIMQDSDDQ